MLSASSVVIPKECLMTDYELRALYNEYVDLFDPTPQYLYDEPYRLLDFEEWYEDIYDPHKHETSN